MEKDWLIVEWGSNAKIVVDESMVHMILEVGGLGMMFCRDCFLYVHANFMVN